MFSKTARRLRSHFGTNERGGVRRTRHVPAVKIYYRSEADIRHVLFLFSPTTPRPKKKKKKKKNILKLRAPKDG
jgi:hypothetical protein